MVFLGQLHADEDVLERFRKMVIRARPDIADKWMLHLDNDPCHTALSVTEFLTSKGIPVVSQRPYSPDFSFFLNLKMSLKNFILEVCNGHAEDHIG